MTDETTILAQLKNHDIKAFKALCMEYSGNMETLAFSLLNDANQARDLVTDILGRLWAKDVFSSVSMPLQEFLFEEVRKAVAKGDPG